MAKRFGGFTPQQQHTLLSKMGYTGPAQQDDINKFMMSSPKAASMMGKYAQMAKARVEGGPQVAMQVGGMAGTMGGTGGDDGPADDLNKKIDTPGYDTPGYGTPVIDPPVIDTPVIDTPVIDPPGYDTPGYDPSQGLPTAPELKEVNALDFFKQNTGGGYYLPNYNEKALAGLVNEGSDLSGATAEGNTVTFADGKTITTKSPEEAAQVVTAAGAYSTEVVQPNKTAQDTYNQQLDQYKTYQTDQATKSAEAPVFESLEEAQGQVNASKNLVGNYMKQLADLPEGDPQRATLEGFIADEEVKLSQAEAGLTLLKDRAVVERNQNRLKATSDFEADPSGQVTRADVATMSAAQKEAGMIAEGTGQAGETSDASLTKAAVEDDVAGPVVKDAVKAAVATATPAVQDTVSKLVASTGRPTEGALAAAATMTPEELASLGLTVDQIEEATQVIAPAKLAVQEDELISGSAVDFEQAKAETNFTAATGVPSSEATVQGQLTGLLEQFEGGETPAWAAGAMRAATATLAARGLGASSMAGQAVVQAAMESAMPIAMADAQTRASFEAQNLSNKQQAAMFAAEQRSKFLGMEFDQEFQTRVKNASRIADVANQNFTAEVQISMENARLTQTVDIANLDARNAKIMSDAAAMSQVDITNLNNRQQAAIQYANSFLQMDMANLTNEQQATMFKSQSIVEALFSDQAAENSAEQFNATSENQTNQFYDSLTSQVDQFNADQGNAMERFNAGEANALAQFNAGEANRREEFNATQSLVIEQANAKWAQDIALTETAAINEANRDEARAANEMTAAAYEAQVQLERDEASYSFQNANNNADRATEVAIQVMKIEASADEAAANKAAALASAVGSVVANIVN